jgi:sugar phosphate isomerase/epimerase
MRLGISSFTYTWAIGVPGHPPERPMDVMALIEQAGSLGVHVMQIADNLPLHRLSPAQLDGLARRAAELDIALEVGTRGIAPPHLRTYLRLAQRLKSPILRVVIDTADHQPDEEESVALLKEVVPEFRQAGICLAVENHDRFKARALAGMLARVSDQAGHCLGVCLDTVNSFGALEGPEVVLEALGPLAVNLHVKDFAVVRASHMMGFSVEGRPAGRGQLNIPWLLQALRDLGRDVNAIVELWTPSEETLAATIAKESAWAAASVSYLRSLIPG